MARDLDRRPASRRSRAASSPGLRTSSAGQISCRQRVLHFESRNNVSITMRFDDAAEEQALRKQLREYFATLAPAERRRAARGARRQRGRLPTRRSASSAPTAGSGFGWPTEYGGQGRSAVEQYIVFDEIQRAGVPFPFVTVNTVGPTIMRFGTDEQKAKYLPKILAGELNVAIGYTEPSAGTDLASLRTTARLDGDEWVINGSKVFTSGANQADLIWLACRTEPDAQEARRAVDDHGADRLARLPLHPDRHGRRHRHDRDVLRRRPRPGREHRRRARRRLADDHHAAQPRARRSRRARRPGLADVGRGREPGPRETPVAGDAAHDGRRPAVGPRRPRRLLRAARGDEADQLAAGRGDRTRTGCCRRTRRPRSSTAPRPTSTSTASCSASSAPPAGCAATRPAPRCRGGSSAPAAARRSTPSAAASTRSSARSSRPPS